MRRLATTCFLLLLFGAAPVAGQEQSSSIRMLDGFAPFYDLERRPPRSWAMPFAHLDLALAPYVDTEHLEASLVRFDAYCANAAKRGYDHVFVGNLIHVVTFDGVAGGPVYAPDSPYRKRAEIYADAFRRAADMAHRHGVRLVMETDFPAWTPPLERWMGGVALDNPRLWTAYEAAIRELFDLGVDALQVRIGEGGGAYDEGNRYVSGILVHTVAQTQDAIRRLLEIVEGYGQGRIMIFRTWTIGIGEIGALHTNPGIYERVFAPFGDRPALVVSIKHVAMDFFEHVPLNPTIGVGKVRQIVEFQARREYEGFGLFPNYRGESFRTEIAGFKAKPTFAGMCVWTTNGGFLLQARSAYKNGGPDAWVDQNVYAYAKLLEDPTSDPRALAEAWAREQGLAQTDAQRVAEILLRSDDAVRQGYYVGAYAENAPRGFFGLDVFPTMLWVYWTRPSTGQLVQCLLGREARQDVAASVAEGQAAVAVVYGSLAKAEALSDSPFKEQLVRALRYERSFLHLLACYRAVFLNQQRWALEGDGEAYDAWQAALPALREAVEEHDASWSGDRHLPAMDTKELRRQLRDDALYPTLRWVAAGLALALLLLSGLLLLPLRRGWVPGRQLGPIPPAGLAAAVGLLCGLGASVFTYGRHASAVVCGVGGSLVVAYLIALGVFAALRRRVPGGTSRLDPSTAALVVLAPKVLHAAGVMIVFAVRGQLPLYAGLVDGLLDPSTWVGPALVLFAFGALQVLVLIVAARGCGLGGKRALGGAGALLAAWLLTLGLAAWTVGIGGLTKANDLLRLAPTVLGEAGTYPEEFVH